MAARLIGTKRSPTKRRSKAHQRRSTLKMPFPVGTGVGVGVRVVEAEEEEEEEKEGEEGRFN